MYVHMDTNELHVTVQIIEAVCVCVCVCGSSSVLWTPSPKTSHYQIVTALNRTLTHGLDFEEIINVIIHTLYHATDNS